MLLDVKGGPTSTVFFVSAQVKDNTFLDWFSRGESRHPVFGKVSGRWFQHVLVSSIHLFVKLSWGVQAGWIILE